MNAREYQAQALRTLPTMALRDQLAFAALEMASESGETSNLIYKHLFQGHPFNGDKVVEELGDVLWGIAAMCDALGTTMDVVMQLNIAKLHKRYPQGFTTEASIARRDHDDSST